MFECLDVQEYNSFPDNVEKLCIEINMMMNNLETNRLQNLWVELLTNLGCKIKYKLPEKKLGDYCWKYTTKYVGELKSPNEKTINENIRQDIHNQLHRCYIKFLIQDIEHKLYFNNGRMYMDDALLNINN